MAFSAPRARGPCARVGAVSPSSPCFPTPSARLPSPGCGAFECVAHIFGELLAGCGGGGRQCPDDDVDGVGHQVHCLRHHVTGVAGAGVADHGVAAPLGYDEPDAGTPRTGDTGVGCVGDTAVTGGVEVVQDQGPAAEPAPLADGYGEIAGTVQLVLRGKHWPGPLLRGEAGAALVAAGGDHGAARTGAHAGAGAGHAGPAACVRLARPRRPGCPPLGFFGRAAGGHLARDDCFHTRRARRCCWWRGLSGPLRRRLPESGAARAVAVNTSATGAADATDSTR